VRHALAGIDLGFGLGNRPSLDVGIDLVKYLFGSATHIPQVPLYIVKRLTHRKANIFAGRRKERA